MFVPPFRLCILDISAFFNKKYFWTDLNWRKNYFWKSQICKLWFAICNYYKTQPRLGSDTSSELWRSKKLLPFSTKQSGSAHDYQEEINEWLVPRLKRWRCIKRESDVQTAERETAEVIPVDDVQPCCWNSIAATCRLGHQLADSIFFRLTQITALSLRCAPVVN